MDVQVCIVIAIETSVNIKMTSAIQNCCEFRQSLARWTASLTYPIQSRLQEKFWNLHTS